MSEEAGLIVNKGAAPNLPADPSAARQRHPLFLSIVQFVALMSILPSIVSFGLYGFGQMVAQPYYFILDGKGGYSTVADHFVFSLPKSSQTAELLFLELALILVVFVVTWGLIVYAAVSSTHRRYLVEMLFALALPAFAVLLVPLSWAHAPQSLMDALILWLPKLTLFWFAFRGRFFSLSTLLFVLLAVGFASAGAAQDRWKSGSQVADALFVFLLAAGLLRLISIVIGANTFFFNELGTQATLRCLGRTALLWLPMFLISAPYFIAEFNAEAYLNRSLRTTGPAFLVNHLKGVEEFKKLNIDTPLDSRAIVEMTAARQLRIRYNEFVKSMREQQQELLSAVSSGAGILVADVLTTQANATTAVNADADKSLGRIATFQAFSMADASKKAFDSSFNKPLDLPASHSDVPIAGKAIDLAVDTSEGYVQQGYSQVTGEMGDYVAKQGAAMDKQRTLLTGVLTGAVADISGTAIDAINSTAQTANAAVQTGAQATEQTITTAFDLMIKSVSCQLFNQSADGSGCPPLTLDVNKNAQLQIWYSFAFLHTFQMFTHIVFGFICVKSFFYVFSRVAFNHNVGAFLTLGELEGTPVLPDAQITRFSSRYVLHPPGPAVYYVSRKFQGRGRPPHFSIPQPIHAPIARLIHGAMTMNKVVFAPGDGPVSYTARFGSDFVVWDLQPGEEIVFNFRSFVAMAESVHISTLISARLSALVLGEIIYSTATGPGQIIFLTEGRAEVTNREESGESLPPNRFVAMHRDARLNVESELGVVDVYISDAYVQPTGHGQVIVDVDRQEGGDVGLIRFLAHFVWPG